MHLYEVREKERLNAGKKKSGKRRNKEEHVTFMMRNEWSSCISSQVVKLVDNSGCTRASTEVGCSVVTQSKARQILIMERTKKSKCYTAQ